MLLEHLAQIYQCTAYGIAIFSGFLIVEALSYSWERRDDHLDSGMSTDRLPPEVLSEIFICSLEYEEWVEGLTVFPNDAPFLFTRICRHWRSVALSTPRLWSNLHLPMIPWQRTRSTSLFTQIPKWLSFSRSLPLSFSICIDEECFEDFIPYMSLLLKEAHRWKSVRLHAYDNDILTFPDITPGSMPLLEEFEYDGGRQDTGDGVSTLMTTLASAPRLRKAALNFGQLHKWVLPWANLTNLQLNNGTEPFTTDSLVQLCNNLAACVRLELFEFYANDHLPGPLLPPTSHVVLPELTHFELVCDTQNIAVFVMHTFSMPKLKRMEIQIRTPSSFKLNSISVELGSSIVAFARHSGTVLTHLRLRGMGLSEYDILPILRQLPNLEEVELQGTHVTAHFFHTLTLRYNPINGRLLSGQNLKLKSFMFLPAHERGSLHPIHISPRPPFVLRAVIPPGIYPNDYPDQGRDTPQMITFLPNRSPPNDEANVSPQELQTWLATVSSPAFASSLGAMIHSRWALPGGARTLASSGHDRADGMRQGEQDGHNEGEVVRLAVFSFGYFNLDMLARVSPAWATFLMDCWIQGLKLNIWCSDKRARYWHAAMGNRR